MRNVISILCQKTSRLKERFLSCLYLYKLLRNITPYALVLIVIIIFGAYLRLYGLHEEQVWIDEMFVIVQAEAIKEQGIPLLDSGVIEWKDILYPLILALYAMVSGESIEVFARLISIIFGISCIPAAYFVGKLLRDRSTGILFSFLIAFSYFHIAWSRQIKPYEMFAFEIILFILCIILHARYRQMKYLYCALGIAFLSIFTKVSGVFLILAFFVYGFLENIRWIKKGAIIGLVLAGMISPIVIHMFPTITFSNYLEYYLIDYYWWMYGPVLFLAFIGGWVLVKQDNALRKVHITLLFLWISSLLFISFLTYVNQFRYAFPFSVVIFLYASAGSIIIFGYLKRILSPRKFLGVVPVFVIIFLVIDYAYFHTLRFLPCEKFCALEYYTPQPNFKETFNHMREQISDSDIILSPYPYVVKHYLGRTGLALSISYTGKEEDISIVPGKKEYYSGAPEVDAAGDIIKMAQDNKIFVMLDRMGFSRIHPEMRNFIYHYMHPSHTVMDERGDVTIYTLGPLKELPNDSEKKSSEAPETSLDVIVYPNPRETEAVDVDAVEIDLGAEEEGIYVEVIDKDF